MSGGSVERTAEAAQVARALRLSPDSIGRYARDGRIPFDTTPGGHRRFNLDEVRAALADEPAPRQMFTVPAATRRVRQIRSVTTPAAAVHPAAAQVAGAYGSGKAGSAATALVAGAWRVQRSVPLATA
jgi:excisionase family DNA binding protein